MEENICGECFADLSERLDHYRNCVYFENLEEIDTELIELDTTA